MDLLCYLHPGWEPRLRPAPATRAWMDATPEAFAYRCLPLNIANAHGWEILCPCDAEAYWTGGTNTEDVIIRRIGSSSGATDGPVSLFGQGTLTFHVAGLFRTPPGWDLWVGGSPNLPKDGIAPLSAVVETDWSPYTFTMNWKFTRRHRTVRFRANEPICFIFPIRRGVLERVTPKLVPLEANPALQEQFAAWSRSRSEFQARIEANPPAIPADKWQKRYYRGQPMPGGSAAPDHRGRLRLLPFAPGLPDSAAEAPLELTEAALARLLRQLGDPAKPAATVVEALSAAGVPAAAAERIAASGRGSGPAD